MLGSNKEAPPAGLQDVFSFGVILWELLTGQEPWKDRTAIQVRLAALCTMPQGRQAVHCRDLLAVGGCHWIR